MRPPVIQQQPHHFVRRWPRARRDRRGPSEYVKVIEVEITRQDICRMDRQISHLSMAQIVAKVLAEKVIRQLKPRWKFESAGPGETFTEPISGTTRSAKPIRFYRVMT